jgi:multidrug efflux pump subunit AcrB
MEVAGFSINIVSLLGMVLAIGLVVDDAIVVVETWSVSSQAASSHSRPRRRRWQR